MPAALFAKMLIFSSVSPTRFTPHSLNMSSSYNAPLQAGRLSVALVRKKRKASHCSPEAGGGDTPRARLHEPDPPF